MTNGEDDIHDDDFPTNDERFEPLVGEAIGNASGGRMYDAGRRAKPCSYSDEIEEDDDLNASIAAYDKRMTPLDQLFR